VKKKAKSSGTTASKRNHNGAKKNRALATYEVWGRVAGRLRRLQFGLSSQIEARRVRRELTEQGHSDLVIVQRPPRYGRIKGLQNRGLKS
jgi:hypothetical protein